MVYWWGTGTLNPMEAGPIPAGSVYMNDAIFMAFDDRHWVYALSCLKSIKKNYPNHPTILIFYNGENPEKISHLKSVQNSSLYLNYILPDYIKTPTFHKDVNSKMVYYKYLLWTDLFDNYGNILHLDVDTIILYPLDDIFNLDNFFIVRDNAPFSEVTILPKLTKSIKKKLDYFDIKIPDHNDMANAGVFMIPRKFRSKRHFYSLNEITTIFGSNLKYADQSALSLWCIRHMITPTEKYEYNYQMPLFSKFYIPRYKKDLSPGMLFSLKKDLLNNIKIIHFSGATKPTINRFLKWRLMGRYARMFYDCYNYYKY